MGLLEGQDRPEVRMVLVLQILASVVRAVILSVRIHPRRHPNSLRLTQCNIVVLGPEVLAKFAGIGSEAVRRQVMIVAGFGMILSDDRHEAAANQILVRPVEKARQLTGQIQPAHGLGTCSLTRIYLIVPRSTPSMPR